MVDVRARPHPQIACVEGRFVRQEDADQHGERMGPLWVVVAVEVRTVRAMVERWDVEHNLYVPYAYTRRRGTNALMPTWGHSTLLDPPVRLHEPIAVRAGRGDVLFAHYLLGHNSGGRRVARKSRVCDLSDSSTMCEAGRGPSWEHLSCRHLPGDEKRTAMNIESDAA